MKVPSVIPGWIKWLNNILMILKGSAILALIIAAFGLLIVLLHFLTAIHPVATLVGFFVVLLLAGGTLIAIHNDWLVW